MGGIVNAVYWKHTLSSPHSFFLSPHPREIFVQCGGLNTEICLECKGLCTSSHPNTFEDMKLSPDLFPKCLVSNLSVLCKFNPGMSTLQPVHHCVYSNFCRILTTQTSIALIFDKLFNLTKYLM